MNKDAPNGWHVHELGDITEKIEGGGTPARSDPAYWSGDIPWVTVKDLKKVRLSFAEESISALGLKQSSSRLIPKNTLIVATRMALGKAVMFDRDVTINQDLKAVFPKNTVDSEYLLQWYLSKSDYIQSMGTGSTVKGVRLDDLKLIPINLPPRPEQQKIASILTSVDNAIESTQAQINKLKDLKTGMMQELLTKGIGHTQFKNSPVGRIPKAWEVRPLGQVAKIERGRFSQRPRNDPAFYGGTIPFLQTGDIPKESPFISSFTQTLNDKGLGVSKLFGRGTLVLTIAATIGEIGLLKFDSCFPDSLVGLLVDQTAVDASFLLYSMRSRKEDLESLAPQTAQKNINLEILNSFLLAMPLRKEQKEIGKSMESIDLRIEVAKKKYFHFSSIKKALMQDLLTGKVRVKVD